MAKLTAFILSIIYLGCSGIIGICLRSLGVPFGNKYGWAIIASAVVIAVVAYIAGVSIGSIKAANGDQE